MKNVFKHKVTKKTKFFFGDKDNKRLDKSPQSLAVGEIKTMWSLLKAALLLSVSSISEKRTLFLRVFVFKNIKKLCDSVSLCFKKKLCGLC